MKERSIGKFIKELRQEKGISQRELAEKLNLSDTTISRWEQDIALPSIDDIKILSKHLDITTNELMANLMKNFKLELKKKKI